MPLFFFDLRDDGGLHRDQVGEALDTGEAVEGMVALLLADMVRHELSGSNGQHRVCEVRDEAGAVLYRGEMMFRGSRLRAAL